MEKTFRATSAGKGGEAIDKSIEPGWRSQEMHDNMPTIPIQALTMPMPYCPAGYQLGGPNSKDESAFATVESRCWPNKGSD